MLSLPSTSTENTVLEGEAENNPIILCDKADDFNQLLNVFYPKSVLLSHNMQTFDGLVSF